MRNSKARRIDKECAMSFAKLGSQHTVNTTIAGDQDRSGGNTAPQWRHRRSLDRRQWRRHQCARADLNSDGVTKDGSEFMLNTTLSGDQFDVALTRSARRLCGRLDEQRRLAIQSHTSVPRTLGGRRISKPCCNPGLWFRWQQGRRRGGLFSRYIRLQVQRTLCPRLACRIGICKAPWR